MHRYFCPNCGEVFKEPLRKTVRLGEGYETISVCPCCGEGGYEEQTYCPNCDTGWVSEDERICIKCRSRVRGKWGRFLRSLTVEEMQWLQEEVEGNAWEEYR